MIIEYLPHGSPDCPLVRIYGSDDNQFTAMRDIFRKMGEKSVSQLDLGMEKDFVLRGIRSFCLSGSLDQGAHLEDRGVEWRLSSENWGLVALLTDALVGLPPEQEFHQWVSGEMAQNPLPSNGLTILISKSATGTW